MKSLSSLSFSSWCQIFTIFICRMPSKSLPFSSSSKYIDGSTSVLTRQWPASLGRQRSETFQPQQNHRVSVSRTSSASVGIRPRSSSLAHGRPTDADLTFSDEITPLTGQTIIDQGDVYNEVFVPIDKMQVLFLFNLTAPMQYP